MMYDEFCDLLGSETEVSYSQYKEVIEPVYTWHPMFESGDKDAVVTLYTLGGLGVFEDLLEKAKYFDELDSRQLKAYTAKQEAIDKYEKIVKEKRDCLTRYVRNKSK